MKIFCYILKYNKYLMRITEITKKVSKDIVYGNEHKNMISAI